MPYSVGLHKSLIESSFFAPRGHSRIYNLGMQIAQLYLSPYDKLIGFIGDAGVGQERAGEGNVPRRGADQRRRRRERAPAAAAGSGRFAFVLSAAHLSSGHSL